MWSSPRMTWRDPHEGIVDGDHVVVNRDAGGADQDKVADRFAGKLHIAAHNVVEAQRGVGNSQPHGKGFTRSGPAGGFARRQVSAFAGVHLRPMLLQCELPLLLQLLGGAETAVGFAFGQQLLRMLLVDLHALALPVRCVRTADQRSLGPVQTEPAQILDQLGFKADLTPLDIGVFDAQQEVSPVVPGKEPVVECGAGIAHMQESGR